jgi:hypothetical protein
VHLYDHPSAISFSTPQSSGRYPINWLAFPFGVIIKEGRPPGDGSRLEKVIFNSINGKIGGFEIGVHPKVGHAFETLKAGAVLLESGW